MNTPHLHEKKRLARCESGEAQNLPQGKGKMEGDRIANTYQAPPSRRSARLNCLDCRRSSVARRSQTSACRQLSQVFSHSSWVDWPPTPTSCSKAIGLRSRKYFSHESGIPVLRHFETACDVTSHMPATVPVPPNLSMRSE